MSKPPDKEKPMTKLWVGGLALGAVLVCLVMVAAQPPEKKDRGPGRGDGPPPGRPGERPPPPDRPGEPPPPPPPGRFVPGRLMPEQIRDELDLTDEQEKELTALEKEVKERLLKILTPEQKKKLDELRRRGPGGPPPGGPDRPRPPERPDRPNDE
jgi:hypothetical protein